MVGETVPNIGRTSAHLSLSDSGCNCVISWFSTSRVGLHKELREGGIFLTIVNSYSQLPACNSLCSLFSSLCKSPRAVYQRDQMKVGYKTRQHKKFTSILRTSTASFSVGILWVISSYITLGNRFEHINHMRDANALSRLPPILKFSLKVFFIFILTTLCIILLMHQLCWFTKFLALLLLLYFIQRL